MASAHIINLICTGVTGLSFLFGAVLAPFVPEGFAMGLSFAILFFVGLTKLLDSITKSIIKKYACINKEIRLSMLNFKFVLNLYADPEAADVDISECISSKEATVLALSLSLDGFAVGFGAALLGFNGFAVVLFSLLTNAIALWSGGRLGNKVAQSLRFNISWAAGLVLIGLAFMQLT